MPKAIAKDERDRIVCEALADMTSGLTLREIAAKHDIAHSTLAKWLMSGDVAPAYREAQREGLLQRVIDADEELRNAKTPLDVSKAREAARFTRWDLERRVPEHFSPRAEISGPGGGPIMVLDPLERARRYAFLQEQIQMAIVNAEPVPLPAPASHSDAETAPVLLIGVSGVPPNKPSPTEKKRQRNRR